MKPSSSAYSLATRAPLPECISGLAVPTGRRGSVLLFTRVEGGLNFEGSGTAGDDPDVDAKGIFAAMGRAMVARMTVVAPITRRFFTAVVLPLKKIVVIRPEAHYFGLQFIKLARQAFNKTYVQYRKVRSFHPGSENAGSSNLAEGVVAIQGPSGAARALESAFAFTTFYEDVIYFEADN